MLVVGSTPINNLLHWRTSFVDKSLFSQDYDFIIDEDSAMILLGSKYEANTLFIHGEVYNTDYFIAREGTALWKYLEYENAFGMIRKNASLLTIFSMKWSHKYFYMGKHKKSFKHLMDYSYLLTNCFGSKDALSILPHKLIDIAEQWKSECLAEYADYRLTHLPSLKDKSKDEFFHDGVKYYYDHDSLHKAVAYGKAPMYEQCKTSPDKVELSKSKWNALSHVDKCHQVMEEAMVIALERCLIPIMFNNFNVPAFLPQDALMYGLTRVATNLTGGWFRKFAADNFQNIWNLQPSEYHKKFFNNIQKVEVYAK